MKTNDVIIELVRKVKKGDNVAFTDLYNETYKYLHTCVIHIVKDEDVAQDMLQDTYVEIYKNIGQLKDDAGFLGWASTIANRKCFAYLKKNKDVLVDEQIDDEGNSTDYFENIADDEEFIPENIFDNIEKINIIRGIIDELTDVQRACVIGYYYNEQKQDQIADELGIPVNTVKSHLNRAKSKIKEAVGDIEKKQGIKLLSVIPFMVALFGFETKAYAAECVVPAMSASVDGVVATKGTISTGTATVKATGTTVKSAGMALKTKIAIGAVVGALGIGAVAVGTLNKNKQQEVPESAQEIVQEVTVDAQEEDEPVSKYPYLDIYVDMGELMNQITFDGVGLSNVSIPDVEQYYTEEADKLKSTLEKGFEYRDEHDGTLCNVVNQWKNGDKEYTETVSKEPLPNESFFIILRSFRGDASFGKQKYDDGFNAYTQENDPYIHTYYQKGNTTFDWNEFKSGTLNCRILASSDFAYPDDYIFNDYGLKDFEFVSAGQGINEFIITINPELYNLLKQNGKVNFQNGYAVYEEQNRQCNFVINDGIEKGYPFNFCGVIWQQGEIVEGLQFWNVADPWTANYEEYRERMDENGKEKQTEVVGSNESITEVNSDEEKEEQYYLVKEFQQRMNDDGEMVPSLELTYEYDENGNIVKTINADGNAEFCDYKYDENGNMISRAYGDTGIFDLHEYDENNNMTLWVMGDAEGEIFRYRYENTYDEGKLISRRKIMVREDGYDDFATIELFTYDENGRKSKKEEYSEDYDPNDPDFSHICTDTYEYDSNGNCIKETCDDISFGYVYEYEYELR